MTRQAGERSLHHVLGLGRRAPEERGGTHKARPDGSPVSEIARDVFLSPGTVRNHPSAAIGKTGAANRGEAVRIAEESGWL